ncbi:MAG: hypothetical protein KAT32_00470 [Candidatus Moranbacteria bacterium]|nr:hypothetical protein [Candidatus Moranbacteria bacterium]
MKIKIISLICCILFASSFLNVKSAPDMQIDKLKSELKLSDKSIGDTVNDVIGFVLGFVAALSVLMIIVSGVMFMFSAGDRDRTEDAMEMLMWAVGGLVISLLGFAIVKIIASVLGAG